MCNETHRLYNPRHLTCVGWWIGTLISSTDDRGGLCCLTKQQGGSISKKLSRFYPEGVLCIVVTSCRKLFSVNVCWWIIPSIMHLSPHQISPPDVPCGSSRSSGEQLTFERNLYSQALAWVAPVSISSSADGLADLPIQFTSRDDGS
ncbi:hypothetical protein NPIL_244711 [Nephila pilipes]|uniref:Uncharacterized protein n=1 Tax=Nephila pilipes TaxID=299642 RepID=A0A8X6QDB7_NEPPI|nr:hypothetical protein NPIL_244711 [Nephila pilipes]